ncbi:MAG: amidase family protein [Anderseniella sp.]|jgi:amidase|nr:amidase family protein [Anderseniella sp.]
MAEMSLVKQTATALVAGLNKGEITPHDLLDTLEARVAAVDGKVNALPTLCFERARAHADELMNKPLGERGLLAGMPVPIKDLADVAGVRSTQGSLIFKDTVPEVSDILVTHLETEGGIVYAKSNTPEFGAGANTFNEVFGRTLNPWNTARSAAGSSGGAAVALATGMAWLAHGSDMGGSLRNPASFNSVCGMRPSPGRVATSRGGKVDGNMGQEGPMARNVEDLALLFDAMCGEEPGDPVSKPRPQTGYLDQCRSGWRPKKVAFSRDLGITPVEPEVARIVEAAARRFEDAGVIVEEAQPDLSEAHECFQTLRALSFATGMKPLLEAHRDKLKPEVIWNIEKGLALTADQIVKADHQRAAMFHRTLDFFGNYDLLLCPATIVSPFPVGNRYVEQCDGHKFDTYIDWLAIVYAITNVCAPALSIPAGFTQEELPVGIQIIGRPNCDGEVLAGGRMLEEILGLRDMVPIDPRG